MFDRLERAMGLTAIADAASDSAALAAVRDHIRRRILVSYVVVGLFLATAESIVNFVEGRTYLGITVAVYAIGLVVAATMIKRHPRLAEFSGVLATFLMLLGGLVYMFESGVISYLSWSFIFIPVAFALQGIRRAVSWTLILTACSGAFYLIHPAQSPIEPVMMREWAISFLVVFLLTLLFQLVREYYERLVARLNQRLQTLASTDQLTQTYNRRSMERLLDLELAHHADHDTPPEVSVILFDLDHFKRINDSYGHLAGDAVLRDVANLVRRSVRPTDYFGRWGGEEFLVLTSGSPMPGALDIAERLRDAIASHDFSHKEAVTASFGVSSVAPGDTAYTLLRRADSALYAAKEQGRNCVAAASHPATAAVMQEHFPDERGGDKHLNIAGSEGSGGGA